MTYCLRVALLAILSAYCLVLDARAVELELYVDGLDSPILVTHSGEYSNRIYVVEKTGKIFSFSYPEKEKHLFLDVESLITTRGNEQGLLSISFHPDYSENGYLFLFYTATSGDNTLARLTVKPPDAKQINLETLEVLIAQEDPASNHNGGMLAFGKDGYLYLGLGDGGRGGDPWNNAQNLETFLGKMIRIDVSQPDGYSIPETNPFLGEDNILSEIWAYGLRNPWRHSFDRQTGDLWIADVGQNKWEEIHWQPSGSQGGENYGWRLMEGNHCYLPKKDCEIGNLIRPVAEYAHQYGCSITGGYVYRGKKIKQLYGKYIFGDFCAGTIWFIDQGSDFKIQKLMDTELKISSFGEDATGELYVLDYQGSIFKFIP